MIIARSRELHKKKLKEAAKNAINRGNWQKMFSLGKELAELSPKEGQAVISRSMDYCEDYMVIDLRTWWVRFSLDGPNLAEDACRTTELWLRRITPGSFMMGSPKNEMGRKGDENQHYVTLTQTYYIGVFECTQK